MKGLISIFCMPQEVEDLALTLNTLKRNSVHLDGSISFKVDITMCLSEELTEWSKSSLQKDYIKERTEELCEKYLDWCECNLVFEEGSEILGCVSQRRKSHRTNNDVDFFLWLDCDMFFNDYTLYYAMEAVKYAKQNNRKYFVVSPEFVKQWDHTWDCLVNSKYLNEPVNYHFKADLFKESLTMQEDISIFETKKVKFAGGWFTIISKDLIDLTGVPDSFGHYGLEDTFIVICTEIMRSKGYDSSQFLLRNIIAGEIHKHRTNSTIKKFIASKNRKEEFRLIAESNFNKELNKFQISI